MSVLARLLEHHGIPTVVVTPMPAVAQALGAPRIVGVECPFGHPFGMPHDVAVHQHVLTTALTVLAGATTAGTRIDVDIAWPQDTKTAYRAWQPPVPSPLVASLMEQIRKRRTATE